MANRSSEELLFNEHRDTGEVRRLSRNDQSSNRVIEATAPVVVIVVLLLLVLVHFSSLLYPSLFFLSTSASLSTSKFERIEICFRCKKLSLQCHQWQYELSAGISVNQWESKTATEGIIADATTGEKCSIGVVLFSRAVQLGVQVYSFVCMAAMQ